MWASFDDATAERLADLEDWQSRRLGSRDAARREIARETGLSEGSLEGVRRRRLKGIRGYVAEKIRLAYVAGLAREQGRLARALAAAERDGRLEGLDDVAADAAREARAALIETETLITRLRGG